MPSYSNYIVYVDESGGHSLKNVDPTYPVFVLAFCVFEKSEYAQVATREIQALKFTHFGHDIVVLHEHEIRKTKGHFRFLTDKNARESFYRDLDSVTKNTPFQIIATCVDKGKVIKQSDAVENLYNVALNSCLSMLDNFLLCEQQDGLLTHVVF